MRYLLKTLQGKAIVCSDSALVGAMQVCTGSKRDANVFPKQVGQQQAAEGPRRVGIWNCEEE